MTGKFPIFIFLTIIVYIGRTLRSGKSYQPRSENDQPARRKKQRKLPKNANPNQSPNQPQPNPDPPHPSPKQKAIQNHPVHSSKSPEPTSQTHPQSSQTTRQSSPTSQTGLTVSDVKTLWTDLKDPISYSGDSAKILNKIRSFQ